MRELEKRQKVRRWLYSRPVLGLMLVLGVLLAKGTIGVWQKERESAHMVRELEEKARTVALREEELTASIASLSTEEGIEEEIRQKFDVSEEGEEVVVIIDSKEVEEGEAVPDSPWYTRFWNAIMHR